MATIVDVANAAKVSVATVSRVLNGTGSVRPDLRRRVQEAVELLRYVPNPTARNLRCNESRAILILSPNVTNPYYARVIAGIGDAAHEAGYSHFLCNTKGDREREEHLLGLLRLRRADGAITLATNMDDEWIAPYAAEYPIVQCCEYNPALPITRVAIDNHRAALEAVSYLTQGGHTRIGLITSENRYASTHFRDAGYRDALAMAGLPCDERYVRRFSDDYTFPSGVDAARSLLSQEQRPTALFCISDVVALGAVASAREMGFRVPQDVTVIGFDDVEHTTMFHPYLTTVAQPCYDLGHTAMRLLCMLMRGQTPPLETILPHRFALRESSAPRHPELMAPDGFYGLAAVNHNNW